MSARSLAPKIVCLALLIGCFWPLAQCMNEAQLLHHHGVLRALYVNTLKKSVTGILLETPAYRPDLTADTSQLAVVPFQLERRINGEDWPVQVLQEQPSIWAQANALLACVTTSDVGCQMLNALWYAQCTSVSANVKPRHSCEQPKMIIDMALDPLLDTAVAVKGILKPKSICRCMTCSSAQMRKDAASLRQCILLQGLSMVGLKRLDNLEMLFNHIEARKIPGDLIECGVWRGGASLFMRGLLKAHGITERTLHLVDSFDGLPKASTDADDDSWSVSEVLKVPLESVQGAFERYGLLDNQVQFHKGYFRDSLPAFRETFKGRIALLRMDGDMYESTTDILYNLVDLMSPGACIVVDDWLIPVCQRAVKDFFATHSIEPRIHEIDATAVFFCLETPVQLDTSWYDSFNARRIA